MKPFLNVSVIAGVMLAGLSAAAAQPSPGAAVSFTRFSGVAGVPAAGTVNRVGVEVKDWALGGNPQGFQVPAQGFYIAQLRSGEAITTIGGQSERRVVGDFWTVEPGQIMAVSLAMHCKVAQLRTIAISPRD
jgi:hypothetical protein